MESNHRSIPDCRYCGKRQVSIFRTLDGAALSRLESMRTSHRYRRGQVLHYEGTPCSAIHCLESGRAKVLRTAPGGKMCILRLVDPGEVLGMEALYAEGHLHTTTAEMIEDGMVCLFEREPLLELIRENRDLCRTVLEFLSRQLRTSEAERVELAVGDVRERTARALVLLSRRYGQEDDHGTLIGLKLSREEIAEMIGAAAETVIRQLTEFRTEGLLANHGRQLVITDVPRLARVAHLEETPSG
jgi:CRP/FNR family transcriptional regulator